MVAIKLKGKVTPDRQLVVEKLPKDITPGAVEVIVLHEAPVKSPRRRSRSRATHPAFGLWAGRADIDDSVGFAAQLRRLVENREDARG